MAKKRKPKNQRRKRKIKNQPKIGVGHIDYSGAGTHETDKEKEEKRRRKKQILRHLLKTNNYDSENV